MLRFMFQRRMALTDRRKRNTMTMQASCRGITSAAPAVSSGVAVGGTGMPFFGGSIAIDSPANGSVVVQGAETLVKGSTTPVVFTKNVGDIENDIPPLSVTVSLDGGAGQSAVQTGAG